MLGPLERLKIVQQVNSLVKYTNPSVDKPKNTFDLSNKVLLNQGMFAYYRGTAAFVAKLFTQHASRFFIYDRLIGKKADDAPVHEVVAAATGSALFTTLVAYPLDFAHGRMASDMSKKSSLNKDARKQTIGKGNRKSLKI